MQNMSAYLKKISNNKLFVVVKKSLSLVSFTDHYQETSCNRLSTMIILKSISDAILSTKPLFSNY